MFGTRSPGRMISIPALMSAI